MYSRRVVTTGSPIREEKYEPLFQKYAAVFYVTGALIVALIVVVLFMHLRRRVKNQSVYLNSGEVEPTLY